MTEEQHNPFQAPETEQTAEQTLNLAADLEKKFKDQLKALVVLWSILGILAFILAGALIYYNRDMADYQSDRDRLIITGITCFVSAFFWLGAAVASAYRKIGGMYLGLVLSYLSLISSAIGMNVCGGIIFLFVVIQGHRVIKWAKEAEKAKIVQEDAAHQWGDANN